MEDTVNGEYHLFQIRFTFLPYYQETPRLGLVYTGNLELLFPIGILFNGECRLVCFFDSFWLRSHWT